jgi:hypothetical protein
LEILPFTFQKQGPRPPKGAGTCLRSHSKQIRILGQGEVLLLSTGGIPHFLASGAKVERPQCPEGGPACGLGVCPSLSFPLERCSGYPPLNSGHPSKDYVSKAGNWAGPRKSPSGRQIPTGLKASGARASLPNSSAPSPLVPSICLSSGKRNRDSERTRPWQKSHRR